MKKIKNFAGSIYLLIMVFILYAPIVVLIVSSVNASPKNKAVWGGFTLKAYTQLFHNDTIMSAVYTTLLLAVLAAGLATVIGTAACIGMAKLGKKGRMMFMGVTNIPLLNADIVTGISLMLILSRFTSLSFNTMLISHVTLIIPYTVLSVWPKVVSLNSSTYEAALDLGAHELYAVYKVILPELKSGIIAGFMLAFTMSMDDFSVTYFTKAAGINTLSTMINSEYRKGIQSEIYALSTLIFIVVIIVLFFINRNAVKKAKLKDAMK